MPWQGDVSVLPAVDAPRGASAEATFHLELGDDLDAALFDLKIPGDTGVATAEEARAMCHPVNKVHTIDLRSGADALTVGIPPGSKT